MNRLNERDLRVLHVSAAYMDAMIPPLIEAIAEELYAHPDARPHYTSIEQVRSQSRAWIRGVMGHADLDALDATLLHVARIHRRIGISEASFIEICAMIADQVTACAATQPIPEAVRASVIHTFNRVLFRQAMLFCSAPAHAPEANAGARTAAGPAGATPPDATPAPAPDAPAPARSR